MGNPNYSSKSFEDVNKELDELLNSTGSVDEVNDAQAVFEEDYAEMLEIEAKRQSFMWTLAKIQAIDYKIDYVDSDKALELTRLRRELVDSLEID